MERVVLAFGNGHLDFHSILLEELGILDAPLLEKIQPREKHLRRRELPPVQRRLPLLEIARPVVPISSFRQAQPPSHIRHPRPSLESLGFLVLQPLLAPEGRMGDHQPHDADTFYAIADDAEHDMVHYVPSRALPGEENPREVGSLQPSLGARVARQPLQRAVAVVVGGGDLVLRCETVVHREDQRLRLRAQAAEETVVARPRRRADVEAASVEVDDDGEGT
ncbi:putative carboxylesterase 18 [Iris pallida]|uniref:Carboxylesterase 18 n=1 Tax=Iris pallida TaxID=29817 RepID=A0AAX6DS86_IRIPA|nr:putative carboxylesterase 18 [Iris pallida]KAJ6826534.1 putative carboxylesterase 18 [Iris pallida]